MSWNSRQAPDRRGAYRPHAAGRRTPAMPAGRDGNRRILVGAAVVLVGLLGLGLYLGIEPAPPQARVLWLVEKTTGAPSGVPQALRDRLYELAVHVDGTVQVMVVAEQAHPVGTVDLTVLREGDRETDLARIRSELDGRLAKLVQAVDAKPVSPSGFSLYAALQAAADVALRDELRLEVWFSTAVLTGTVHPMDMATLTATDPRPAVEDLRSGPVGHLDLGNVDLHPVLLTPVGAGQRPLAPGQEAWRSDFTAALGVGLGADVAPQVHDNSTADPWRDSARVPVIAVPQPPQPSPPAGETAETAPALVRLDTSVVFTPNRATLIDAAAARAALAGIVRSHRPGAIITVDGYCAAFGEADGARALSLERAEVVAELLAADGVPRGDIRYTGHGFDTRADPAAEPRSPAQRAVVVTLVPNA